MAWERDPVAWDVGVLQLRLQTNVAGRPVALVATFPDLYPYFRFEVAAPHESLGRHQHPGSKYLCLLGRRGDNWSINDTLADFVRDRVPRVFAAAVEEEEAAAQLEEHQGEPFSDYYDYEPRSILMVDSKWRIPDHVESGEFTVCLEDGRAPLIRGVVSKVIGPGGEPLGSMELSVLPNYPREIVGRWFRMSDPIPALDARGFLARLASKHPEALIPRPVPVGDFAVDVIGVNYPEEVQWRESGAAWVFLVRVRERRRQGGKRGPWREYLTRAGRAGRGDFAARIPELSSLNSKSVGIVGLGGIGAPSALEFARCGVRELKLIDDDHVEPATSVRWPFGLPFAGFDKVDLDKHIRQNWPYTSVLAYPVRLGACRTVDPSSQLEVLRDFTSGLDLLYDSSADLGVQYFLSELARELAIPYVAASSTAGAWGGRVVRIVPGQTAGCWVCLMKQLDDGNLPLAPADPSGEIQPVGCADQTFTGPGFDLAVVAIEGVRAAVRSLSSGDQGEYPRGSWDVGVLSLRNSDGNLTPPTWATSKLDRHPMCPRCLTAA